MRKFISALLISALIVLPSCGNSGESGSLAPESPAPQESAAAEETPTPEPAEEPTSTPEPTPEPSVGKLVKMTAYGPYDEIIYWHDFAYGPDGKMESVTSYSADGAETGRVDYSYDEEGNALVGYRSSEVVPHWDSDGNIESPAADPTVGEVKIVSYGLSSGGKGYYDDGSLQYENLYDDDGKLTRWNSYYKSGGLLEYILFEYDAQGRKLRENYYTAEDVLRQVTDFEYSDHKTVETTTVYSSNDGSERVTRQVETEFGDNDKIARRATTAYEGGYNTENGWLEFSRYTEETYSSDGQIILRDNIEIKNEDRFLFERQEYTYE